MVVSKMAGIQWKIPSMDDWGYPDDETTSGHASKPMAWAARDFPVPGGP